MLTSDLSSVTEKVFLLRSDMKRAASDKSKMILAEISSSEKYQNPEIGKFEKVKELYSDTRNTFVTKFVGSGNLLQKAQILTEALINSYTVLELEKEPSVDFDNFLKECEVEYLSQTRRYADTQFNNLLEYDGVQLCDALLVLKEAKEENVDQRLKALPLIMELIDWHRIIKDRLTLLKSQYNKENLRELQESLNSISEYESIEELSSLIKAIYKEISDTFTYLALKIEEKIEREKSSTLGSAAAVIEFMKEYRIIETDFLLLGLNLQKHRYDAEREKLERDLKATGEILSSMGAVYEDVVQQRNPAQRILIANTEATKITKLVSSMDSRYVEFKEVIHQLDGMRKAYTEMMDKDIASLLEISVKVPEDYTSLQPENQFRHWKERLTKLESYMEGLAEVDKAVAEISKAKAKLMLSGETYAVDLCRRYPKATGSFNHHLQLFDAVVNGMSGVRGTERVRAEMAKYSEFLRDSYQEFMEESEFAIVTLKYFERNNKVEPEKLIKIRDFIYKYKEHHLLTYPEVHREWIKAFKLFQQNETAIDEILEQTKK
ncbi:MAG: hypothetical protein JXR56_06900 [Candidatus Cloacimonetes bacterium]|nr:hypothetical protein [Candidatus Cloacimonadota bacterium]